MDIASEIISGQSPGGTNTSHTIAVALLTSLLSAVPPTATHTEYGRTAIEDNVLGKATVEGRRRTFRYLRELYLLDPERLLFRALRDLWDEDVSARPLLAGLAAFARDSVFRASAAAVLAAPEGASLTSSDLTKAVTDRFPGSYNPSTAAKVGRNTASSWTQTGHLRGRRRKVRLIAEATPASAAYALLLGHLDGARGQALYGTRWAKFVDQDEHGVAQLAEAASKRGYLELRAAGGVVDISFRHLLRPSLWEGPLE